MPALELIANLWTLNRHPTVRREWSLEIKLRAVAAAGFTGFMARLTPEHARLADKFGLARRVGFVVARDTTGIKAALRLQQECGAELINVHLGTDTMPPAVAAKAWVQVVRAAEGLGGLRVSLETHRDYCTETPEKTQEIIDRFHAATGTMPRLTFDFSHWAIVKHVLPEAYAARLLAWPELIQAADQIHFRPFNGHHVQVPVTHAGKLTPEVRSYLPFACAVMDLWRAGKDNRERTLVACPELGPEFDGGGGYCLSTFPAPWPETVRLRSELVKVWRASAHKK